jgi:type III secretion protein T
MEPWVSAFSIYGLEQTMKGIFMLISMCTTRILVAMILIPATNDQVMQGMIRNGFAVCLGLFLALGQSIEWAMQLSTIELLAIIVKEAMLGVLLGFATATIFWVAEGIGVMIDNQAGYNNVQQTNPLSGEQSTPVGNTLSQLSIAGFYMLGGMVTWVGVLYDSYTWWPLAQTLPSWTGVLERFVQIQVGKYLIAVAQICGPVLLVLLLVDIGIGLISKIAEKLEANNLAQPIKGSVALFMLSLLVAVFFDQVKPQLAFKNFGAELKALSSGVQTRDAAVQSSHIVVLPQPASSAR